MAVRATAPGVAMGVNVGVKKKESVGAPPVESLPQETPTTDGTCRTP